MTFNREHHRDSEESSYQHKRKSDLEGAPDLLRWGIIAIKSIGISSVMCLMMFYITEVSMKKLSESMERQSASLEKMILVINNNHEEGKEWRARMLGEIKELQSRLR